MLSMDILYHSILEAVGVVLEENNQKDLLKTFVFTVEYPPKLELGHFASNVAMKLATILKKPPQKIAGSIRNVMLTQETNKFIKNINIDGPGFLNFTAHKKAFQFLFNPNFHMTDWVSIPSSAKKVHFEFVSANPTGPLNIVSARSAAIGDSICNLLRKLNIDTFSEYYINDHGNQIHLLGVSVAIRYLQNAGIHVELPDNAYQGDYIKDIATSLSQDPSVVLPSLPSYTHLSDAKDIQDYVTRVSSIFAKLGMKILIQSQKRDLQNFKVDFNQFFSEEQLHINQEVEQTFQHLQTTGLVYKKDDAYFFKSTQFNDDRDRVIKRSDGTPTYFLADIAYHRNKFERGFTDIHNIWGPDHHGYITRLQGAMEGLGYLQKKKLNILIVQQVNLLENGKIVVMSKRLGKLHTMYDLLQSIPRDVARFFFTARSSNQHLDFDLTLALDLSKNNPVYYIQYAHARIYSIFKEVNYSMDAIPDISHFLRELQDKFIFDSDREALLVHISRFKDELHFIAHTLEIHRLNAYLYKMAHYFTKFYHHPNNQISRLVLSEEDAIKSEAYLLLHLCRLTALIIQTGLNILCIEAPESM